MHLFSTDGFLLALADAWFPGKPRQVGLYEVGDHLYRLLSIDGASPITEWPFLDFHAPVALCVGVAAACLRYLPHAVVATAELGVTPPPLAPGHAPAPFIAWNRFGGWAEFEAHFAARRSSLPRDSRSKRRGLERDLGPLTFTWDDPRPEVLERCLAWKSAQYRHSGYPDVFAPPRNRLFFELLRDRGVAAVSSLSAGGRLVAAHLGAMSDDRRCYSWIASYDPDAGRYSPGRLLLEDMLRESQARRHLEWDFGIGTADYKWHYATHSRVVGPVGAPPLTLVLEEAARARLKGILLRYPALYDRVRRLRSQVRRLRGSSGARA